MSKNENRLNFRMTDETATKIERWYQEDNCRSKNEFIEKAVNCYADMLAAGESTTLPRAVQSAIDRGHVANIADTFAPHARG